ncbi:polyprenyl synthetase family protein [Tissierella sp. MB52-C2]|uniref:polyprenyl synthetase family protein n=1 Tax=Tissierella sp. MB52-C2 TaxID=3070999 RepID=UPI00280A53AE|nr:polyprenyl synthetase family protein [Tissierella sp. MB52-C2]WMM26912.1 polyprenyl synthetase family protein [Tissierella sp. MB52-C2]
MDLNSELKRVNSIIDIELKNKLKDKDIYQKRIVEAIDYSLFTGGKRLRPIMAIKSYELFKDNIEEILPYAMAIEMIHTYSLIHDDLPSMDNDDFRRGKPTSHKVFGEAMAILAGDGLLNLAFETMADHIDKNAKTLEDYKRYTRAFKEISKYSGIYGMIGGQVVDLLATHSTTSEEKLLFMYETKTAALIRSALVSGAIIGDASDIEIEAMRNFGLNLGLAYQIRDDILDINKDKSIKKLTYLSFHNLDRAKIAVEEYSNRAMDSLKELSNRKIDFFVALTGDLMSRNK